MKNVIDVLTNNVNGQYNTIIIVAMVITLAVMIAWYVVLMKTGEYSDTSSKVKPSDVKNKEGVKAPTKEKKDVDVDKLVIQQLKRGHMFFDERGSTTSTGLDAEELFNDLHALVSDSKEIAKELKSLKEQELRTTSRIHHKSLAIDLDGSDAIVHVTGSRTISMSISEIRQIKSIVSLRGHINDGFILKHDAFDIS